MAALAVGVAGCGGGKKAPAPTRTPARTATAVRTVAPANAANCKQLLTLRSQVEQALGSGRIDPRMPRSVTGLADQAPPEIRPDAKKVAVAYGQVVRALEHTPPDADPAQRLARALGSVNAPGLTSAIQRINRWTDANCAP